MARVRAFQRILKTLSWRVFCSSITVILVLLFTKKLEISLEIGLADMIIKTLSYYLHEILWERRESLKS